MFCFFDVICHFEEILIEVIFAKDRLDQIRKIGAHTDRLAPELTDDIITLLKMWIVLLFFQTYFYIIKP